MTVKETISAQVTELYGDNCPHIYKGYDYDGTIQAYGWWYAPFGHNPMYLGTSKAIALETLEEVAESWGRNK